MADKREPDRHTTEFMSLMRAGACNEAFSLIYKPAERASRGALRTLGVDGDDAKEIFHQVLLELFASTWIRFKQECSILTLIYGMAYKRGVDLIVRRSHSAWTPPVSSLPARQADEAADDPIEHIPDLNAPDPDVALCARGAAAELRERKPKWWEVLLARATKASSDEELAEEFGMSHGAFRNLLYEARNLLVDLCRKHCGVPDCTAAAGAG
jgi:DNA-directed RNA polymerase specialized sigma24 family protein